MGLSKQSEPHNDLTGQIIGAAQAVHTALKPGLDEKLYENALCIELSERGLSFSQQKAFPVYYRNHFVGKLIPDLVVEDRIIVETKIADNFNKAHISQVLGYLNITGLDVGLLLNFKLGSLQVKRVSRFEGNPCESVKSVVNLQNPPEA